jgi:ABC-2 type transport system ATP-binding protein
MSSQAESVITVSGLSKRYGATLAVDGIDFDVPAGSTLGLLGGNGAGKSTTIAMLLGLLIPTTGRITVLGHDMARDRFAALARMNFSSPYVALPARLSVEENLRVYCHLYDVRQPARRIAELARELDLQPILRRLAGQLSAGQKTRVALAKSLINRPDVLLLDEPTASLDPTPATSCGAGWSVIGARAAAPSCSPRTIWPRSSGCATAC